MYSYLHCIYGCELANLPKFPPNFSRRIQPDFSRNLLLLFGKNSAEISVNCSNSQRCLLRSAVDHKVTASDSEDDDTFLTSDDVEKLLGSSST